MSEKRYVVTLTGEEREHLTGMLRKGRAAALVQTRARVRLKADQSDGGSGWDDARIADALGVGERTVSRVRRRFVDRGFEASLRRKPQEKPSRERVLDGAAEARLVTLACSKAPGGRAEWTLQLLADKLVELDVVPSVSDETVRRVLKKTRSSRGRRSSGASPGSRRASSSPGWKT